MSSDLSIFKEIFEALDKPKTVKEVAQNFNLSTQLAFYYLKRMKSRGLLTSEILTLKRRRDRKFSRLIDHFDPALMKRKEQVKRAKPNIAPNGKVTTNPCARTIIMSKVTGKNKELIKHLRETDAFRNSERKTGKVFVGCHLVEA